MAKDLADLVVSLELQSAKYQKGFDQATARLTKFQKDTTDGLKKVADIFAGALSADAILSFAKSTIDASAELSNFSKSSGIAVEQLSALQFAAAAGGVGTEALNTSLKKLNISISEASGNAESTAATAFKLMGINVRDAGGHLKDASVILNEMADVFKRSADGPNKVALAVATLGKQGEALIPTLDKGSAGLKELADQAAAAGAIIDGPTAEAADAFNNKLFLLKTTLINGIGAQVEKQLLPALNSLASEFLNTAKGGEEIARAADEVAAGFKLLISGGLIVYNVFQQVGNAIGGVAAALGALTEGGAQSALVAIVDLMAGDFVGAFKAAQGGADSFKKALDILKDTGSQAAEIGSKTADQLLDTWQSSAPKFVSAVKDTVDKTKTVLGSLAGAEAFNAAVKTLNAFVSELQGEATKLDQGTVAATRYKLAHGELAKALAQTGATGKKLAADAIAAATQIETNAVNKQLESLQTQLKAFSGDTAGAALDNFNKSVQQLEIQLKDVGGATQANGQAIIDNLKQATVYQNTFNLLQANASRINQDAAAATQAVTDAEANGSITSIEAEQRLQKIRADTLAQLQGIKNGEDSVAAAANNPAITQGVKAFGSELDHLKAQNVDPLIATVRNGLESAFANNFSDLITGAKSFGQAITGLLKDIQKQFADLIAKNFAQQLFNTGSGGSGGGLLGGLAPALAGLFGGGNGGFGVNNAVISGVTQNGGTGGGIGSIVDSLDGFATGGVLASGKMGIVGENGPELITGQAGGTNVIPNGQGLGGGVNVTNHFIIQSQDGRISRQSQTQVAAAAARALGAANQRNNR